MSCSGVLTGRRVLRRGSKKGLSRRRLEGRNTPFRVYDPLACARAIVWHEERGGEKSMCQLGASVAEKLQEVGFALTSLKQPLIAATAAHPGPGARVWLS